MQTTKTNHFDIETCGGWATETFAEYIGAAPATVKKSRVTGKLLGRPAPPYRKIGKTVRYDPPTAKAWLLDLPLHQHTAAHKRSLSKPEPIPDVSSTQNKDFVQDSNQGID